MKKKIGIITYAHPHLRTEQVLTAFNKNAVDICVFALPFIKRKSREELFQHRPNQNRAISAEEICKAFSWPYILCDNDYDIQNGCDFYIITGANLSSEAAISGKTIINCHSGNIIPNVRGLDCFKWAIYDMLPLENTLHIIDQNVDLGTIVAIWETPVFSTDTIETIARRHYESEINMLNNTMELLKKSL